MLFQPKTVDSVIKVLSNAVNKLSKIHLQRTEQIGALSAELRYALDEKEKAQRLMGKLQKLFDDA